MPDPHFIEIVNDLKKSNGGTSLTINIAVPTHSYSTSNIHGVVYHASNFSAQDFECLRNNLGLIPNLKSLSLIGISIPLKALDAGRLFACKTFT